MYQSGLENKTVSGAYRISQISVIVNGDCLLSKITLTMCTRADLSDLGGIILEISTSPQDFGPKIA